MLKRAPTDEPAADVESLNVVPKRDPVKRLARVSLCVRQLAVVCFTVRLLSTNREDYPGGPGGGVGSARSGNSG